MVPGGWCGTKSHHKRMPVPLSTHTHTHHPHTHTHTHPLTHNIQHTTHNTPTHTTHNTEHRHKHTQTDRQTDRDRQTTGQVVSFGVCDCSWGVSCCVQSVGDGPSSQWVWKTSVQRVRVNEQTENHQKHRVCVVRELIIFPFIGRNTLKQRLLNFDLNLTNIARTKRYILKIPPSQVEETLCMYVCIYSLCIWTEHTTTHKEGGRASPPKRRVATIAKVTPTWTTQRPKGRSQRPATSQERPKHHEHHKNNNKSRKPRHGVKTCNLWFLVTCDLW